MSEEIRNLLEGLPFWKYLKKEEKRQMWRDGKNVENFRKHFLRCGYKI